MPKLLQITPSLPSLADGVTATALAIGAGLSTRLGWQCELAPASAASDLANRIRAQSPDLVLLHYVNYAYDSHGRPDWLIEAMERRRGDNARTILCTYFHEVFATAPPWRRTFWVSGQQKRLAARLAAASDRCITSLSIYAKLLREIGCKTPIEIRPIVSSVGELEHPAPYEARDRTMVIFGSAGVRSRAYGVNRASLTRACETLGVETLIDIGPEAIAPPHVAGRPVEVIGRVSSECVSSILSAARNGFLSYPLDFLEKSSVFAAYCAHGVLPVCAGKARRLTSPPTPGAHFWRTESNSPRQEPSEIATAAANWYHSHSLDRLFAQLGSYLPEA